MVKHLPPEIIARVFEEIGLGVTIVGLGGEVKWANSRATELLGWRTDTANSVLECHSERSRPKVQQVITHTQTGEWHRVLERGGRQIENLYLPVELGNERGMVIVTRDVTERETAANALRSAAVTDGLTGLFNRQHYNGIIANPETTQGLIGVIMADLNGLKVVNDRHGHLAGDQLIVATAKLLRRSVRKGDLVFRIGGDEFLMMVYDDHQETLARVMERLRLGSDCSQFGAPERVCLSVGACLAAEAPSLKAAISIADQRMYEAKRSFYEAAATQNKTPRN